MRGFSFPLLATPSRSFLRGPFLLSATILFCCCGALLLLSATPPRNFCGVLSATLPPPKRKKGTREGMPFFMLAWSRD